VVAVVAVVAVVDVVDVVDVVVVLGVEESMVGASVIGEAVVAEGVLEVVVEVLVEVLVEELVFTRSVDTGLIVDSTGAVSGATEETGTWCVCRTSVVSLCGVLVSGAVASPSAVVSSPGVVTMTGCETGATVVGLADGAVVMLSAEVPESTVVAAASLLVGGADDNPSCLENNNRTMRLACGVQNVFGTTSATQRSPRHKAKARGSGNRAGDELTKTYVTGSLAC
jgi:hypothetical protein